MKTIDRFVLKAFLGPMVLSFLIVMFVLMMNFMWRYIDELVGKGLEISVILELMMYATATMIPMGLPLAILFAAIMTMGNLGENNELLALKSCGMSLPRIMMPLGISMIFIAVGSFFVANNLVPYSNKQMYTILYDIRRHSQALEFKDGQFFNGIENMSIRVETQDSETGLLTDVLIYDTSDRAGNMTTTIAESGYIRLSDDKKYLLVTLFNGETYETTRDRNWYDESLLRHHIFAEQNAVMPIEGFLVERSDANLYSNTSTTKSMAVLTREIDSLTSVVAVTSARSFEPLLQSMLSKDPSLMGIKDSVKVDYSYKKPVRIQDSLAKFDAREAKLLIASANSNALDSKRNLTFDENVAKSSLNELYRNEVEMQRKIALPFSILIFFFIGAPLGAIIRKGGLGMPVVISVLFFVIYYIISITGEKLAKDGAWTAFSGMWLSSFILTPIAVYLTYIATNDSNMFNMDWYRGKMEKLMTYLKTKINEFKGKKVEQKRA